MSLQIDKDTLQIYGKTCGPCAADAEKYYTEFAFKDYYRAFTIGEEIDRDKIAASMNNGVLKLVLPKAERVKPKKIDITLHNMRLTAYDRLSTPIFCLPVKACSAMVFGLYGHTKTPHKKRGFCYSLSTAPYKQWDTIYFIQKNMPVSSPFEKGGYRGIFCSLTNPPNPLAKGGFLAPFFVGLYIQDSPGLLLY